MSPVRHSHDGLASALLLCRTICILTACMHTAMALPQGATGSNGLVGTTSTAVALIPSAPRYTALIPSGPPRFDPPPSGLIQSQTQPPNLIPSQAPPELIPSVPTFSPSRPPPGGLIPSGPIPSGPRPSSPGLIPSGPGLIPSMPPPSAPPLIPSGGIQTSPSGVAWTAGQSMVSTEEGLRPIPGPTTAPGNPDGHHEITEPGFSATAPCRGCSPIVEVSVTGFFDWPSLPAAEHVGTSALPPSKATITAGPSEVIISKEPSGGFVIGGSTTVKPGQTVIIDNTPVVIQTSAGNTQVIVGSSTMQLKPNPPESADGHITAAPMLQPVTVGGQEVTANDQSQYVIGSQTLHPGGPAIVVDGTTVSLMPQATAIVINGVTSTLAQAHGAVYTTTTAPFLTINNKIYTANRAGFYVLAPGTTLIPGGPPVTISGTVVSLEPKGTAAIIQGSTSHMAPATTIVTLTKGGGYGGQPWSTDAGGNHLVAGGSAKPTSGSSPSRMTGAVIVSGWFESILLLGVVGLGWLTVWL